MPDMESQISTKEPTGLLRFLIRLGGLMLPGFLVSMILVFLTTELAKLGSLTTDRQGRKKTMPETMGAAQPLARPPRLLGNQMIFLLGLLPAVLLGITLFLFLNFGGAQLLGIQNPSPGSILFNKTVLSTGQIELQITNPGPQPITIVRLDINDSIMPFQITPSISIPQFGEARVHVAYPWVQGEAYTINLFTSESTTFTTSVESAEVSVLPTNQDLLVFTLMGVGIGLIPLLSGIALVSTLSAAPKRKFLFPMALTMGLLAYSGFIVTSEALKHVQAMSGAYQGIGLVVIGVVSTFLALDTMARWQAVVGQQDRQQRLNQAWLLSLGTGLRSWAQGLVIGATFSVGATLLGTLLLVSFIVQSFTEGLIWMEKLQADRPSLWRLLVLAGIGGAPAVFGIWTGAYIDMQPWTTLFFAIGGGAFLQAAFEFYRRIQRSTARQPRPFTVFAGVLLGLMALYIVGLFL